MSWYNFSGPVQGSFGPLSGDDDERRRRRRDSYRDAGAPYAGGGSGVGSGLGADEVHQQVQSYGMPQNLTAGAWGQEAQRGNAPRQVAAVDLGQGAHQPLMPQHATRGRGAAHVHEDVDLGQFEEAQDQGPPPLERPQPHAAAAVMSEGVPGTAAPAIVVQNEPDEPPMPQDVTPSRPGAEPKSVMKLRADVGPDPRRVRFASKAHEKVPWRYAGVKGEHQKAWKAGKDKKFEIKGADELRRIAAQGQPADPAHRPPPMPQDHTPSRPKKDIQKKSKRGPLRRARAARDLYRDHAKRQEGLAVDAQQESQRLKLQQVQLGNTLKHTRQEKRRTLQQMRDRNKSMLDQMGQRHGKDKAALMDAARDAMNRGAAQQRDYRRRQMGVLHQYHQDRHMAQRVGMQQGMEQQRSQMQSRIGGLRQQRGQLQTQLQRQQAAASESMRTGRARQASMEDQLRRQGERAGEMERVGGAQLRSQQSRITAQQQRIGSLTAEGNDLLRRAGENVQRLQAQINQGTATSASLQDALRQAEQDLAAARQAASQQGDLSAADKTRLRDEISRLATDLREAKQDLRSERAAPARRQAGPPRGGGSGAPIVVQGGSGGGGASSSAGGASAAGGTGAGAGGRDLSRTVEALAKAVKGAKGAGDKKKAAAAKGGGETKGITRARRSYTDKRKAKIAELRSLKGKRIREHEQRTKSMPKADRDKARREFKKKVNAQFKEAQQQFPTARGLKSVGVIRELIRKLEAFRPAK